MLDFWLVDAFTEKTYSGNPAAVIQTDWKLAPSTMQKIAREMNLSETVFVGPSSKAHFKLRFFTPRKEIDLAGHPTIAAFHVLWETDAIKSSKTGPTQITQELNVGVLPIGIEPRKGKSPIIVMTQKTPKWGKIYSPEMIADVLGLPEGVKDLLSNRYPIQTVSTGTPQLMVPVRSLEVLENMKPNFTDLEKLEVESDFFSTHVFTVDSINNENHVHARHFAPSAGVLEDPVTGSASGGMGAYIINYKLIETGEGETHLRAEQGHFCGRPGLVHIWISKSSNEDLSVKIGGTATTVGNGCLVIPE